MTFWPRMFSAVVCWFLSMLALLVVAAHYLTPISAGDLGLGLKVLAVVAAGIVVTVVLVAGLAFWFWVWARKYW